MPTPSPPGPTIWLVYAGLVLAFVAVVIRAY